MKPAAIEIRDLYFTYPDGCQAIAGISARIGRGETVGIVGVNGAGKSTLLLLLVGVLFPSLGDILVEGALVTRQTLGWIRAKLGLVFQDPDDQLFMPTVYDDVAFGPRNYRLSESAVQTQTRQALEAVGILSLRDRPPYQLSGGEKKAAAIAAVLSMQPEILVLDEPTAGLDPKARRRAIQLLNDFPHTKVVTSHDLDMVYTLCDRTIVLTQGRIVANGPTGDILGHAGLMGACGLELPLALQNCPVCGRKKSR